MAAAAAALSEEALLNWQQQVDEVQALEAIYGDSFQVLEVRGVLESGGSSSNGHCGHGTGGGGEEEEEGAGTSGRGSRTSGGGEGPPLDAASLAELDGPCSPAWALHCSLMVGVEPHAGRLRLLLPDQLPQQQDVQQGPSSGSDGGNGSPGAGPDAAAAEVPASGTGKTTAGAGCTVQYLPPICMQLRLGGGYPGQEPPGVSLSALWLGAAQVARLQRQLLRLWHEQGPGGPVCYTWADWLQSSALQLADDAPSSDGSTNGGGVAAGEPRAGSSGRPDSPGAEGGDEVEQEVAEERLVKLLRCGRRSGPAAHTARCRALRCAVLRCAMGIAAACTQQYTPCGAFILWHPPCGTAPRGTHPAVRHPPRVGTMRSRSTPLSSAPATPAACAWRRHPAPPLCAWRAAATRGARCAWRSRPAFTWRRAGWRS